MPTYVAWLKPVVEGYRPKFYWYELLECVRKLSLVGLLHFVDPPGTHSDYGDSGGIAQLLAGSLIAGLLLCTLCAARPYQLRSDNALAIACQGTIFVTLQLALYLRLIQLETAYRIEEARL